MLGLLLWYGLPGRMKATGTSRDRKDVLLLEASQNISCLIVYGRQQTAAELAHDQSCGGARSPVAPTGS
jgi:hypothetical protein